MRQSTLLTGTSVLVVEDEIVQALDLTASLKDAGAEVCGPFFDMRSALQAIKSDVYCTAIIDFRLASQNTRLLLHELYRRGIPFIVYTGWTAMPDLPSDWAGCKVISKPAYLPKLMEELSRLIRWKRFIDTHRPSPHSIAV